MFFMIYYQMKKTVDFVIFEHLVIFIFLCEVLRAKENIIIQRQSSTLISNAGTRSTWKAQPDRFIIPLSWCVGNGSAQCNQMGGSLVRNCTCECNQTGSNGRDFSSSTFGIDGGRWKCLPNVEVHQQWECSVILNRWGSDSALITVPNVGDANYEVAKELWPNFQIYKATSKAQKCDNSWTHLDYDIYIKNRFSEQRGVGNRQYLKYSYSGNSSASQKVMTGRLIRLGAGYLDRSHKLIHTCVLLKMPGEIQCPFTMPPTPLHSTTEPSSVLSATTESSLSTSIRSASKPNTYETSLSTTFISATNSKIHTTSRSSHTVTISTRQTSLPMVIKTSARNTSSDDSTGLIAGAVAGVIGFIALVIVMILVRRRKKRESVTKRTSEVSEENGYGTNRVQPPLEDQDEYAYAYASTVSINEHHVDHHPTNKGVPNDVTNSMYGSSAGSPPQGSNILKVPNYTKPEYAEVNKRASKAPSNDRDEPLYNVLEGPDAANENEPPYYHVLEGPFPDSGPVYDVLEEPGSVTSLPNQHSAQTRSNTRSDVEENRGYNDTVYDSVEEVIPDTGDIYQQLNQDGQREPGVYQALTFANQEMPLAKLNSTYSEA